MRETFYTDGRQLFDPTGNKVILRGVNKMSVWDGDDPTGAAYFPEIRKTQANSVRIVWAITKDLDAAGVQTDLDTLDALITNARKNQLIPMIELHDATGKWERLQELVDYWVQPDVVTLIQKHQAYLLVNIGNEVGDDEVKPAQFIAGYKKAVKRMRDAGIQTPLVIDASDWGKKLDILDASADKLIDADPDKNLIFSVHLYWSKSDGADTDFIQSKLEPKVERDFPLIVGEFSQYGGYAGEDENGQARSMCSTFGEIDYQTILKVADDKEIGWYAWEWGPGNAKGTPPDPLCVVMDMTPDGKFEHLKDGWATDVLDSIKTASEKPGYFSLQPIVELSPAVKTRIETLTAVLTNKTDKNAVSKALQQANGDWSIALASLTEKKFPKEALRIVALANSLADWTDDNVPLVTTLAKRNDLTNLRDVALNFNVKGLTTLVAPAAKVGTPAHDQAKASAIGLRQKLFATETTAVLQRMVLDTEIPIADAKVLTGITQFLNNQPEFNIRTTSIYTVLKDPKVFKDIAEEQQAGVIEHMKTLQRVQALTLVPEAVPVLMNANLTSAFHVGEMPESTFLRLHGEALGGEQIARDIHYNAINNRIRNEQTLITIQESVRGSGFAIMDDEPLQTRMAMMRSVMPGPAVAGLGITPGIEMMQKAALASAEPGLDKTPQQARMEKMQDVVNKNGVPLNLEALFGSIDYCECNECQSVYSPASYFVELLQYLRNNNLDPNSAKPGQANPNIHPGIKDTPLEKLFLRRPDLGCLELTCENTFTVLPYIDLVNEVMESFVVNLDDYSKLTTNPKQSELDAFNVEDETTSELLAQPQHTNYQAYCILKSAVYPFTLPYHQPIDAIRIFLNYLGTSRYELLDTYRTAHEVCLNTTLTPAEQQEIQALHDEVQDRAVDAEFLGLTQEEYIILTKEAFWRKRYFDINQKVDPTDVEYRQKIGVKPVYEYYGYDKETDMLMEPKDGEKGLTFVKKQFLPRTGIQYTDLVELLKTHFINPNFPQGKALTILESIRFSYRFLQTFVKDADKDKPPTIRFAELIKFLEDPQALLPDLKNLLHPEADPCKKLRQHCPEIDSKDLRNWVYCYFDRIGQLIVLESGEGPRLEIYGDVYAVRHDETNIKIGILQPDGKLLNLDNPAKVVGQVDQNGIFNFTDQDFEDQHDQERLYVWNGKDNPVCLYIINANGNREPDYKLKWLPAQDTCNLDKVRLIHLDGSSVTAEEYDGIHRFIRLWRKLGWTIDETDKALTGLVIKSAGNGAGGGTGAGGEICEFVGFDVFVDTCPTADDNNNEGCGPGDKPPVDVPIDKGDCPDPLPINTTIAPEFLHQLVAVKKLLDLTGLPLIRLLAFWADISIAGEKSLYARLFLTHNLLGIDKVFKADVHGNYLTETVTITDHLPVLMAALKLKADDITAIMGFVVPPLTDALTLPNVSVLYRYSLLAKVLHVKVADLPEVIALFSTVSGNPFKSTWNFLALIETWGKMEDAGFTFRQLNYIIREDDKLRPLAPSKRSILQITKTLYDGLTGIDRDHKDLKVDNSDLKNISEEKKNELLEAKKSEATADLVRTKVGLLFEASVVEKIIGLLEGTTVYSTNAPINLAITLPESDKTLATLAKKLKYSNQKDATPPSAGLQVTGILTPEEQSKAKALSSDSGWAKAIDRIGKQPQNIFNDALLGIFSNPNKDQTNDNQAAAPEHPAQSCPPEQVKNEAKEKLLAGDVLPPDGNTALDKRFYFLLHFLRFLRQQLAHRFIVDTLAGAASLTTEMTDALLSDLLTVGPDKQPAITVLESIKEQAVEGSTVWKGYLIPSTDEAYTFVAKNESPPSPLTLDGEVIAFKYQQEDPSNIWSTDPTAKKLKSGKLYWLEVTGQSPNQLQWKTATLSKTTIPTSALLPDFTKASEPEVFTKLTKAALLINGFNITVDEVTYWQAHASDFDGFDLNAVSLKHWQRLQAYTTLRNSLPKAETNLLGLFEWAAKPVDAAKQPDKVAELSKEIADVTNWKPENIKKLVKPEHFDLDRPEDFRNEVNLVKLQKAIVVADKIAVDIDRLFEWAKPGTKFWACHQIAEDIHNALRARYDQEDWEQVVKPLNDQLRENQKLALIAYLLVQPDLIDWGVIDADSLFEFFLIDVQMDACMETSRIKQAISSVQLFVQRCFLGLEDKQDENGKQIGVPNDVLDRGRWEWMQRYRVWEANRKVFLYPENWIEPQLRDDKSPFYKELESELLQKDINKQTVEDALKSYLIKVDEVASLKVVGQFLEQVLNTKGDPVLKDKKPILIKQHIFARTRNAPYVFYYRYFDFQENNWYPWEKMQVDIPSYDQEDKEGKTIENGAYLIPVVWNQRLLVFFPQFVKKIAPVEAPFDHYWEIKMGWSDYRNGKWTQKQVSADAVYNVPLAPINEFKFIPRIFSGADPRIVLEAYTDNPDHIHNNALGEAFCLTGSQLSGDKKTVDSIALEDSTNFHYYKNDQKGIHSFQAIGTTPPAFANNKPFFTLTRAEVKAHYDGGEINFYHPFAHDLLGTLNTGGFDSVCDYYLEKTVVPADPTTLKNEANEIYGEKETLNARPIYNELKRPYSIYNWEATFHAPMLLVDRLLKAQQFEQALKMCHHVFNPYEKGIGKERFWQFPPFKVVDAENVLEKWFNDLKPNTPDNTPNEQINEWRDKPFLPHVIARSRPSAYMKCVVMKYLETLIAWGDYLFRQDTIETLNEATQLYVLASHIYGPRGQKIPKRGRVKPQTYLSLLDKWDAFGNAMVELELVFPFSNQTSLPIGSSNGVVGLANVFGFATTLYFCIPDNPKLRAIRDTIDDRLFKIRHCQNIAGVFRKLPLFEPPIDPALLVQAAAQGLSLSSVLNDLNSPMPNYRFYYLLQKALELCSELKTLGNAFLSAKEKGDAEALSQLRARHESSIHNLVMEVKKQQLEEANHSKNALEQSRKAPVFLLQHYLNLLGVTAKIPNSENDFSELPDQIEPPVDEGELKLNKYEKEGMDKATAANDKQEDIGRIETIANILHAVPNLGIPIPPFPPVPPVPPSGYSTSFGGSNLGSAMQAWARANQVVVGNRLFSSADAERKAILQRQLHDRFREANNQGYVITSIDKQILTQEIRINITQQEITNQQKQIDNAQEMEEFLRNKYTNQDLYTWMDSQIRTLYHQAYTLAYEMAKKAEKVFRFERGQTTSNFIQYGYWDSAYDGLYSGERLYIGLKQLEAAYQENRGYDFEVTKPLSLRQINPLALIELKENGMCEFALPEVLFDMDYSGHYMRRIKSVSLTIPCVVGPYTSVNCTLRLLEHKFRTSAIANGKGDYPERTDETDDRFSTVNVPITSIAASTGQNDSGVFELNFKDERYIPFEGAGAISKWRLELPKDFRQFDYDTISDVVMQMRYTALDGGDKLKKAAGESVQAFIKGMIELSKEEGLFAAFDLKHDFPDEWYKAMNPPAGATERVLALRNLNELLPVFTKGPATKIELVDAYLFVSESVQGESLSALVLSQDTVDFNFKGPTAVDDKNKTKSFSTKDIGRPLTDWQIKIKDTKVGIEKFWLIVRYVLK